MRYPDSYKCSSMFITKFERDVQGPTITYQFINAFPKLVTAVPVSYGGADVLRVSVSFNYDRYIVNPTKDTFLGEVNTFDPDSGRASYDPSKERELIRQRREQSLKASTPIKPVISKRQQEVLDENANRLKVLQETGQGSTPEKRTTSDGREYTVTIDPTFGYEIRTFK